MKKVEIDQSGKIEYTKHNTHIADSLGNIAYMSSTQKRILQKQYSIWNKTRVFPFETFAILVSYLIKETYTHRE